MRRAVPLLLFVPLLADEPSIRFRNIADAAGLRFTLDNSPTASKHMIETMPGGVAAFDFDSDGFLDLFFTNGTAVPSLDKSGARYSNRLFRNEGHMKFRDVTDRAGLAGAGYSMGAAAADFDNDGHPDLFVAGVNRNLLYRNRGDGTFADVTATAGIRSTEWGVAAGWFDFDNDGKLDLLVVNYSEWPPATDRFCGDPARKLRIYCHPKYFPPVVNRLYRNLGGGKFEDVTMKSTIGAHKGRGMSVAFADADADGRIDAFVTNDNLPNFLYRNAGGGKFEEVALLSGVALLDSGKAVASMGVDWRDYDNDGRADLHVTALAGETYPLFRATGAGQFEDATQKSQVARWSNDRAGWANAFVDFDNDGFKDLFCANSHVNDIVHLFERGEYKQANSVFRNLGNGRFADATAGSGLDAIKRAHRGAAFADFNNDGRVDVAVSALTDPAELWENTTAAGRWIVVRLRGTKSNRDGLGAEVRVAGQTNLMTSSVGYASSSLAPVHFGVGGRETVDIEVRWPSGAKQTLTGVATNRLVDVTEP